MTMPPLFERLDKEESVVRGELAALREKVAGLEERLAHLTITRETLLSLTGDGHRSGMDEPTLPPSGHVLDSGVLSGAGQTAREPSVSPGPLDLELARERILVLLAGANQAMKVQDIGDAIGEHPDRVETTRSRLKKLAKEGLVAEVSPAWFAITPAVRQAHGESGEAGRAV
ncbi:hypothetical protein ACQ86D_29780 [Streptomyces galilaeus]